MASQTISADFTSVITLPDSGDILIIKRGVSGAVAGLAIDARAQADDRLFDIAGSVKALGNRPALSIGTTTTDGGQNNDVIIRKTGVLESENGIALLVNIRSSEIINNGLIEGASGVVGVLTGDQLINTGEVRTTGASIDLLGTSTTIVNEGLVKSSGETAVSLSGIDNELFNSGTIRANGPGPAIHVTHETDSLDRPSIEITGKVIADEIAVQAERGMTFRLEAGGLVKGDVLLGDGNSSDVFIRGDLDGRIVAGDGLCLFDLGATTPEIIDGGGGYTMRVSVDTVMPDFFRGFQMSGERDIKVIGNDLNNIFSENKGDNVVKGKGGDDLFNCDKGDDTYFLGEGADHVTYFLARGNDVIVDFEPGVDTFDVFGRSSSFEVIRSSLFNVQGGVEYRDDGDVMFFKGLRKSDLGEDSFDFPS